ncbi:Uncharacterised protein [Klebsiella pneumoniae]|nr:Uncharacterised protein [Klebsiella pneumoniae]
MGKLLSGSRSVTLRFRQHLLQGMRHRDEAKGRGHHRRRAKAGSAVHPLRPFRRALHCADAAVRLRVDQRFRREDAVYTELTFAVFHHPKLAFQPLAQFGRQRILDGLRQVRNLDLRWVNLTARPAGSHQRHLVAATPSDKRRFRPDAIDSVDNIAKADAKIFRHVFRGHEIIHHRHPTLRVDETNTLRHHLRFRQPDVAAEGVDLTIGVGDADIVHIDKGDRPDAGPRQRFRRPGADPADPDHADVGVGKTLQRFFTI